MGDSGGHERDAPQGKIKIAVIAGPTCSGKSSLAIRLAHEYSAEIISVDSRQIYRQLKIGTDRLDPGEWDGVPHHMMGTVDLDERFTVFDFVRQAKGIIDRTYSAGGRIIVCGGTGLYIRALAEGIFEIPEEDMGYRSELLDIASTRGPRVLYEMLLKVDPVSAKEIHPHNMIRVVRALEIYHITGRPKSELMNNPDTKDERFAFFRIVLMPPREELYRRIERRVDDMVAGGLFEEARAIYDSRYREALKQCKVVGYAEIVRHLEEGLSRKGTIALIKQNTRRFAKRQYTWFRAEKADLTVNTFGAEAVAQAVAALDSWWKSAPKN
jgi:tRNA dimethylallyltransferase